MDGRSASSEADESSASQPGNPQHVGNTSPHEKTLDSHPAASESNHNNGTAAVSDNNLAEIVWALKEKIAGLEDQLHGNNESIEQPPELSEEAQQYRRSERYLYKQRKEWEKKPHGEMRLWQSIRMDALEDYPDWPHGPWKYKWNFSPSALKGPYRRPDPFNLPPEGDENSEDGQEDQDSPDEFDRHIDYASRRDTLRKTFEWELDRLWLAEEFEQRRKKRLDDAKQKKEQEKQDKANALKAEARENPETFVDVTELNRVEWSAFKAIATADGLHPHVIDVLIGDPIIDEAKTSAGWMDDPLFGGRKSKEPTTATQATSTRPKAPVMPQGHAQLPERIRIHSNSLLTILGTIFDGMRFETPDGSGRVFYRPFKSLVYCKDALKEWCEKLEEKLSRKGPAVEAKTVEASANTETTVSSELREPSLGTEGDEGAEDAVGRPSSVSAGENPNAEKFQDTPSVEESSPPGKGVDDNKADDDQEEEKTDDITQSDTALVHLKCLVRFLGTEVAARRNRILEPDCQKLFFSDLWDIFRPGTEVIGSDGKQAYRVVQVTTMRHGTRPDYDLWFDGPMFSNSRKEKKNNDDDSDDDDEDEGKTRDLSLTCVYIDFDGRHVGPVLKKFEFKRYEGEKDASSLEVYPLRYHPRDQNELGSDVKPEQQQGAPANSDWLRRELIARGSMFLDVVGVKHMYYSGPTLDTREEVESQVMVDFDTAFAAEEGKDVIQRPELEILAGRDWTYPYDPIDCNTCCGGEDVCNDYFIDVRRSKDYIDGLLPKPGTQQVPSIAIVPRPLKNMQAIGSVSGSSVSDDELLIMSYRVFGFVLRSRKWATLDLTHLSDVQPSGHLGDHSSDSKSIPAGEGRVEDREKKGKSLNAFDRLVLPDGHRRTIKSLIAQHFYDKGSKSASEQVDIVRGKGKGLIMLLHGAPGVGKTSTAEGVAELFKKPLFQITCGDLGTTAKEVEKALETNFALASRWGCILLLDEADVFLAERTKEDFKRNGLVAVFLRVLEYYSGILFLTTNRVGDFDEAFASRIHISLHYPPLNEKNTLGVFQMNLDLIKERFLRQGRSIDIDIWGVSSFATNHFKEQPKARWNGRQIRNACQTALALAEFEAQGSSHEAIYRPEAAVKLTVEHFDTVRKAYLEFAEYMTDLYGSDAARRAKEGHLRARESDENERLKGFGGRGDFLREVQTPLGGGPGRGPPSQYSSFSHSPQQQPAVNRQGYPYQQQQQGYNYNLSPGFQPQQQQAPRSTTTPHAYQQQHDASQQRQSQDFTGSARHDRHPSQTHPPARQGDFFQPAPAGHESFQYREPDVHPARESGEDPSQTPPSMQRPRAGDGRHQGPQDGDEAAGRYQWSGHGGPGL